MADKQIQQTKPEPVSDRPVVTPLVDVYENEKEILLMADLPGVSKDQLSIHVDGDTLMLEGRRAEDVKGSLLAAEYRPQDFRRSFNLPGGIDREKIEASLTSGVLRLKLPKEAALHPRRIPIKTS